MRPKTEITIESLECMGHKIMMDVYEIGNLWIGVDRNGKAYKISCCT